MTAADKLAQLLEEKQCEVDDLQSKIDARDDAVRWSWTRHTEIREEQDLPVPRLEIWLDEGESDDYNRTWIYRMVYRHLLGHCVVVPLGHTAQRGGNPADDRGLIDHLPFRDGCHMNHDQKHLGMPAYMVRGDEHVLVPYREPRP